MHTQILVCVFCFLVLVWHSRLIGISIGLPIAYLFAMLLQHLPGALAHAVAGKSFFPDSSATQIGLEYTMIGTIFFVTGVVLAQRILKRKSGKSDPRWLQQPGMQRFAVYCLRGGWLVALATIFLGQIPSLGAAIEKSGAIWILGVLIGLLASVKQRRHGNSFLWLVALSVYPLVVLLAGGFLSFGSTSIFVVLSALLVVTKSNVRAYTGVVLFTAFSFLAFLSYFQNRGDIRAAVWGGESLEKKITASVTIFTQIEWFDYRNLGQISALDARLNQNKFVGWAAQKIESGRGDFLNGRSIWDGLQAMVPRMLWPDKPVFAGSSEFIREFADFEVNDDTTFGVGQVMELYLNFGVPSLVVGFLLFGFAYGWIDSNAAVALQGSECLRAILWFLPGLALSAPLASIAELMGNVAAAIVGAFAWRYAWALSEGAKAPDQQPVD